MEDAHRLQEQGLEVPTEVLGLADADGFIKLYNTEISDYTQEREELLKGETIDTIMERAERLMKEGKMPLFPAVKERI